MKKITILSFFTILVSLLFVSCSQHLTITKRHYNKGYYVSYSSGKQNTKLQVEETTAKEQQKNSLESIEKSSVASYIDSTSPIQSLPASSVINSTSEKSNSTSQPLIKPSLRNAADDIKHPVSTIKHALAAKKDGKRITDHDHGHSLLWIIIVVILILWAIGFLTGGWGLGGLIHLLLVIALILLILWLLRVL